MFGNYFDTPSFGVTWSLFEILAYGTDVPQVRDAAYNEIYKRAGQFLYFWRIKNLAKTSGNADARYAGIMLLGDILENYDNARLREKCRKVLKQIRKRERDERNRALIEKYIGSSEAVGMGKRLGAESIGNKVVKVSDTSRRRFAA